MESFVSPAAKTLSGLSAATGAESPRWAELKSSGKCRAGFAATAAGFPTLKTLEDGSPSKMGAWIETTSAESGAEVDVREIWFTTGVVESSTVGGPFAARKVVTISVVIETTTGSEGTVILASS